MAFKLPELDYAYNALEPYIDEDTMKIHHTKHHQAYLNNLNKIIEGTEWENYEIDYIIANIDKLPQNIRTDDNLFFRDFETDPDGFYHKTGGLPGVVNDWGFSDGKRFFLITNEVRSKSETRRIFGILGKNLLYKKFF